MLSAPQKLESVNLDLSDDEELREQLDMHSIIVSCITDEPLFTAEQVRMVRTCPVCNGIMPLHAHKHLAVF